MKCAWISVKKRMPVNGVDVLVCALNKKPMTLPWIAVATAANYKGNMDWRISGGVKGWDAELATGTITHWRPLPKYPRAAR